MNILLVALLMGGAYVMAESGSTFIAVLLVVLAVLMLLGGSSSKSGGSAPNVSIHEPYGPEGPIIVENKLPDIPSRIDMKFKTNWHEYQGFEYAMMNAGSAVNNMGNFFTKLFFRPRRHAPAPSGGDDADHGGGHGGHGGHH
ncbi:MAG: hypothetical protein Q8P02_02715 [Candidatus Micrarchaeota archaeon]|nr:hypothetical protein [Candidatus Micrarchaeota archaeon]